MIRYETYHAFTFDLGIINQVVWNTAHGRWFETSIDRSQNTLLVGNYLGNHVRPILLLIAPLYRLWPDPRLLLILQSIALGVAAIFLYAAAYMHIQDRGVSFLVAGCYLLYPALGFLNLADFHPIAFSIPCVFAAYLALKKRKWAVFWILIILALSTKEEMVVPLGTWGLLLLFDQDTRHVGLALSALATLWGGLTLGVIIPFFHEGRVYRFLSLWRHLPIFFNSQADQPGTVRVIGRASSQSIALFLVHLFLPLGFLPFLGSQLMVVVPPLVYLLMGQKPAFHSIGYQYPAVLVPWFFLAFIEGLQRVTRLKPVMWSRRLYRAGIVFLLVGTLGTNIMNPILLLAQREEFKPLPHHKEIQAAMALIPDQAGVATINSLGPHLSNRRVLIALEYPPPLRLDHLEHADYVLLDLIDCRAVLADDKRAAYADLVSTILSTREFRVRYWSDRILLLERGSSASEELEPVFNYIDRLVIEERPCWF
jgi:uncharacterized membrane protein